MEGLASLCFKRLEGREGMIWLCSGFGISKTSQQTKAKQAIEQTKTTAEN
jgi:hypothetical protein